MFDARQKASEVVDAALKANGYVFNPASFIARIETALDIAYAAGEDAERSYNDIYCENCKR